MRRSWRGSSPRRPTPEEQGMPAFTSRLRGAFKFSGGHAACTRARGPGFRIVVVATTSPTSLVVGFRLVEVATRLVVGSRPVVVGLYYHDGRPLDPTLSLPCPFQVSKALGSCRVLQHPRSHQGPSRALLAVASFRRRGAIRRCCAARRGWSGWSAAWCYTELWGVVPCVT